MEIEEFRVIPGYERYEVNNRGILRNVKTKFVLNQYVFNGYNIVDAYVNKLTVTLPVHRAVALAWVPNTRPVEADMVNHIDGNKVNNHFMNLEWVTCSENNYHAIENGLRSDNTPCEVRDFYTKEVHQFASMSQASQFALGRVASFGSLYPKKFGSLVGERYEIRFRDNPKEWFYESRNELVPPSRYMIIVRYPDGFVREIYSTAELKRAFKLWNVPSSIPSLVQLARERFPEYGFTFRDAYAEEQKRIFKEKNNPVQPVCIQRSEEKIEFSSLSKCAAFLKVDRSSIQNRINSDKQLDGWTITQSLPA